MENSEESKRIATSKKKVNTTPIRVLKSTAKTIRTMLNKLNKKEMGR